jgi:prepilin peptidase CpaA
MGTIIMTISAVVFVATLLDAAWGDLRRLRIPNRVPLILLVAFVAYALAGGLSASQWPSHLGAALACFALSVGLFAMGLWGGGDAKLLPALALWAGATDLPRLLAVMALAGGLVALAVLVARRAAMGKSGALRRLTVPYGIAIAAAGLDWAAASLLPRLAG